MKRLLTGLLLTALFTSLALAQGGQATSIHSGSSLPSGAAQWSIFMLTSGNTGLYWCNNSPTCTSTPNWVYLGGFVPTSTTVNTHALTSNVVVSASDITTGTLPHGQLPSLVSGDIPNNAANTSGTAANVSGTPALPNGTTATTQTVADNTTKIATDAFVLANTSGGAISSGTTDGLAYATGTTTATSNTPPALRGVYYAGYAPTTDAAVVPANLQVGYTPRAISGAASTDTVLYSDVDSEIDHDVAGSAGVTETIPVPTTAVASGGLGNSHFAFNYCNNSTHADTLSPTTWTIQAPPASAASTLAVSANSCYRVQIDPYNATNWLALKTTGAAGGDTITSPSSTLNVGGTATNTTLDLAGSAGEIMAGATPALTYTPTLGKSGTAGTYSMFPASGNFQTTLGSAATASNTVNFFATVPGANHVFYCAVSGVVCTMTDAGYSYNAIPNADVSGLGALATVGYPSAGLVYSTGSAFGAATAAQVGTTLNIAQYAAIYSNGTSAAPLGVAAPATNGDWFAGYHITGSVSSAPVDEQLVASTTNSDGLTVTPTYNATGPTQRFEITGNYSGSLASGTGLTSGQMPTGIPIGNVGTSGLSTTLPLVITSGGVISTTSIAGFRFGNASAADTVATAAQLVTLLGSTAIPSPGAIGGTTPAAMDGTTITAHTHFLDQSLTASLPICTDASKNLSSTCTGLVTFADLATAGINGTDSKVQSGTGSFTASNMACGDANGGVTPCTTTPTGMVLGNGVTATTQTAADNSTKVATTAYVDTGLALKSPLASPTFTGTVTLPLLATTTHCAGAGTAANPSVASCSAAPSGFFSCATNASTGTCTVNTTAVTANSVIQIQPDSSLGTALSVTCNTTADSSFTAPRVSARSAGTSFTIALGTFATNPECFSYIVIN